MDNRPLLVACLCAQWCGSCRDYEALFARAATDFGADCHFVWVDIEDDAERAGGIDVDNFPTLLIAREGRPLFFGAITPHPQTLQRLVASALVGELNAVSASDPEIAALAERLSV